MQLDFKEIASNVNLLDFIIKEYPEYAIDTSKSDKTQTRLANCKEEIDVYKGPKGWLYFNRTNPLKGTTKDEGNIIQFLKVRCDGDFKQVIDQLKSYLDNIDQAATPTYREPNKTASVNHSEWIKLLQPLKDVNAQYLKGRGVDMRFLTSIPALKESVKTFSYKNKQNNISFITGFPLKDREGQIKGVELRRPPYKELTGKFTAPGSTKERAFWSVIRENPKRAYLAESPLDLISHMQLQGFDEDAAYIATAGRFGVQKANDIATLLQSKGVTEASFICDNDIHGQGMNLSLASVFVSNDSNLPSYLKVNVKKGESNFYIEGSNLSPELIEKLKQVESFQQLSAGKNYLSFKLAYTPKAVHTLMNIMNQFSKKTALKIATPKGKDWNKDLVEKKKLKP